MKKESKDVSAFVRTYDLILWIIPRLDKFPRRQKFLLADRIQSTLLDILGWITEAVYTKDKALALKKANLGIEKTRHLIRLSRDLKFISVKQYEYISKKLNEIGSEIGGWLKYTQSR